MISWPWLRLGTHFWRLLATCFDWNRGCLYLVLVSGYRASGFHLKLYSGMAYRGFLVIGPIGDSLLSGIPCYRAIGQILTGPSGYRGYRGIGHMSLSGAWHYRAIGEVEVIGVSGPSGYRAIGEL